MKYALIKNGVVINIVKAETSVLDEWVSQGAIDSYADASSIVVDIGDAYTGGNFVKTPPSLAEAKARKLADFKSSVDFYLDAHYPLVTRMQLINLYILARLDLLVNRAAYLKPGVDWVNSILTYSASFAAQIQAESDLNTVINMTWDIDNNVNVGPKLTLAAAISILD